MRCMYTMIVIMHAAHLSASRYAVSAVHPYDIIPELKGRCASCCKISRILRRCCCSKRCLMPQPITLPANSTSSSSSTAEGIAIPSFAPLALGTEQSAPCHPSLQ